MDQLPDRPRIRRTRKMDLIAKEQSEHSLGLRKQKVIYSDKYPQMIEAFKKGWTLVEVASKILHCTREWVYKAAKQDPELNEILAMGKDLTETWWVEEGRKNLKNRRFNSHLFSWLTTNLVNWQNKQLINANIDSNVNLESPMLDKLTDGIIDKLLE